VGEYAVMRDHRYRSLQIIPLISRVVHAFL
jgi:hypothetical protein